MSDKSAYEQKAEAKLEAWQAEILQEVRMIRQILEQMEKEE